MSKRQRYRRRLDVGYDNLSHVGKAFRARFGVLPSEWRS